MIAFDLAAINASNTQFLQRNTLRVEHACDVVVWNDQEISRRSKGRILVTEQMRVDVPMRADKRQGGDRFIEFTRQSSGGQIGREKAVGIQHRFAFTPILVLLDGPMEITS